MTPSEVLEAAKLQFSPLYYNDSDKLAGLLRLAIGQYQDRAGVLSSFSFSTETAELPEDTLQVVSVKMAEGFFVPWSISDGDITVDNFNSDRAPYTVSYLVNLRDMDIEEDDLPSESVGMITDYLVALIDLHNTARARTVATATGVQQEFISDAELRARKEALELEMEDRGLMLPIITVV